MAECGLLEDVQLVLCAHLQHLDRGLLPYLASLQLEITNLTDLQVPGDPRGEQTKNKSTVGGDWGR